MRDFSKDHSSLALNTATLGHNLDGYGAGWPPERVIDACAKRGMAGVTYWVREIGDRAAEIGERTRSAGLRVTGLCRPPYLVGPGAMETTAEIHDGFRRSIDMAAALGAESLTVVVGGVIPGSHSIEESLKAVAMHLGELVPHARSCGVRLGLEPLHPVYGGDRSCLVTTRDAVDICLEIDDPHLGVAIDVYHVWWDTSLGSELRRIGSDRIFGYHLCDWLAATSDVLLDRGMMGDGVADLRAIRASLEDLGYLGHCEVEIFSFRNWWQRDPDEVLDVMVERFRTVC